MGLLKGFQLEGVKQLEGYKTHLVGYLESVFRHEGWRIGPRDTSVITEYMQRATSLKPFVTEIY